MDSEKKELGKWWLWGLGLLIVSGIIFTVLGYAGIIGQTVVERKVFENSYQRSEGYKAKINMLEAQLVELENQLNNPELNETTKSNLEAQAASIRIQLSAARRSQ
jgi:hypothetical protein